MLPTTFHLATFDREQLRQLNSTCYALILHFTPVRMQERPLVLAMSDDELRQFQVEIWRRAASRYFAQGKTPDAPRRKKSGEG